MKLIPLTQGKFAKVDDGDFGSLSKWKWRVMKVSRSKKGLCYAYRMVKKNQKLKGFLMHREIMQVPKGLEIDHINHDGLNNQRTNLRIVTHAGNMKNRRFYRFSSAKGITKNRDKWQLQFTDLKGKRWYVGIFKDPNLATRKYKWIIAQLSLGKKPQDLINKVREESKLNKN